MLALCLATLLCCHALEIKFNYTTSGKKKKKKVMNDSWIQLIIIEVSSVKGLSLTGYTLWLKCSRLRDNLWHLHDVPDGAASLYLRTL